jgi:hypothetical protein
MWSKSHIKYKIWVQVKIKYKYTYQYKNNNKWIIAQITIIYLDIYLHLLLS